MEDLENFYFEEQPILFVKSTLHPSKIILKKFYSQKL